MCPNRYRSINEQNSSNTATEERWLLQWVSRYRSILKDQNNINLNIKERMILEWLQAQPLSKWKLQEKMKESRNKISYKSVLQKVDNLSFYKLIELIEHEFPRNAKFYRLTDRGWFYLINKNLFKLDDFIKQLVTQKDKLAPPEPFFMHFFAPWFELKTLKRVTEADALRMNLEEHVKQCCDIILREMRRSEDYIKKNKRWYGSEENRLVFISNQIELPLLVTGNDLVYRLVNLSGIATVSPESVRITREIGQVPLNEILAADLYFMEQVEDIAEGFKISYKTLKKKDLC